MTQPALSTGRLILRPVTAGDLGALWRLWTEPQVRRFLWDDAEIPRERASETLAHALGLAPRGLGLWMLHDRSDGLAMVGCAGLLPVGIAATFDRRLAGHIEPMVALTPSSWSRGLATEALMALLDHAFGPLGLDALVAVVDVPNDASHRLVTRLGFEVIGESGGPYYRMRTYRLARR